MGEVNKWRKELRINVSGLNGSIWLGDQEVFNEPHVVASFNDNVLQGPGIDALQCLLFITALS